MNVGRLSFGEKLSYGLGDMASNIFWMSAIFFQLYFYTDVFGISPTTAGTLIFLTRLLDTANDPIMGMIADRTRSRWGRFRPYLLYGAVPFGVCGALVFAAPPLEGDARIVYAAVSYFLFLLAYTAVNIPYSSLMGAITDDPAERTAVSTYRFTFAQLGGLFVQLATLPLVEWVRSLTGSEEAGFRWVMAGYGAIAALLFYLTFRGTRERVAPPPEQMADVRGELLDLARNIPLPLATLIALLWAANRPSALSIACTVLLGALTVWFVRRQLARPEGRSHALEDIRGLLTNGPWLILSAIGIVTLLWVSIKNGVTVYYFKYFIREGIELPVVGRLSLGATTSLFMGAGTVAVILGTMSTALLERLVGNKIRLFVLLMLVNGLVIAAVYPLGPDDLGWIFALHLLGSFLGGPPIVILFAMYADTAEYAEYRNGRNITGLVYAAAGFAQKMGWTIGPALAGVLLGHYGYQANVEQNPETLHGLRMLIAVIPGAIAGASSLLMLFYPLDDNKMAKIRAELAARKGAV